MNQWAKAIFHKGSTLLLNYIMEWVLLATGIAGHISSMRSLPKVLFVDVRSRFVLFSLLQKPGCHIPQGLLDRARLICKAFRCCGMAELPV
mgnify:CR=1 FL=1